MSDTTQLTAADVMTANVITIPPTATLRQAARLMTSHRISALPVVEGGVVVAVVSEADLLQPATSPTPQPDW